MLDRPFQLSGSAGLDLAARVGPAKISIRRLMRGCRTAPLGDDVDCRVTETRSLEVGTDVRPDRNS